MQAVGKYLSVSGGTSFTRFGIINQKFLIDGKGVAKFLPVTQYYEFLFLTMNRIAGLQKGVFQTQ